jgi:ABC-type cobalt transport system substrate-binding protein
LFLTVKFTGLGVRLVTVVTIVNAMVVVMTIARKEGQWTGSVSDRRVAVVTDTMQLGKNA